MAVGTWAGVKDWMTAKTAAGPSAHAVTIAGWAPAVRVPTPAQSASG
ncbi:hypothetical protein ABZV75_07905 [Streptomyces flaveolus]